MKAMIILAQGFEEIEAVTVIDVLERANIAVDKIGLISKIVKGAHNIKVTADKILQNIDPNDYQALVLPGGSKGVEKLKNSQNLLDIIKDYEKNKKLICAICAAPLVLQKAGILENRIATIYPELEKKIPSPREGRVVIDKNVITSQGPGTAILFSLKIVERLTNKRKANQLKNRLVA